MGIRTARKKEPRATIHICPILLGTRKRVPRHGSYFVLRSPAPKISDPDQQRLRLWLCHKIFCYEEMGKRTKARGVIISVEFAPKLSGSEKTEIKMRGRPWPPINCRRVHGRPRLYTFKFTLFRTTLMHSHSLQRTTPPKEKAVYQYEQKAQETDKHKSKGKEDKMAGLSCMQHLQVGHSQGARGSCKGGGGNG